MLIPPFSVEVGQKISSLRSLVEKIKTGKPVGYVSVIVAGSAGIFTFLVEILKKKI